MHLVVGLSIFCLSVISMTVATLPTQQLDPLELSSDDDVSFRSARNNPMVEELGKQLLTGIQTIRTVLSFGTQVSDVYSRLTTTGESTYDKQYRKYLSQMADELEGIKVNLNGVSSFLSQRQPLGCSYALAEIQIMTSLRRFNAYNMSSDSEFLKEEFVKSSAELQVSIEHLLAGLNGDYLINADIIKVVRDELDCRQHQFNEKIGRFLGLINTGLELHAVYVELSNITVEENLFFLDRVNQSYARVNYRIRHEIENCVNEKNIQRDIYQLITTTMNEEQTSVQGKDQNREHIGQLTNSLVTFLTEKYSYRTWLVCLNQRKTNPFKPSTSEHFYKYSDRANGIDVVALSTDRRYPKILSARQKELLSAFFYFEVFEVVEGKKLKKCVELDPRQDKSKDSPFHFTCGDEQLALTVNNNHSRIQQIMGSDFAFIVMSPAHYLYGELPSSYHLFNAQSTSLLLIPV